MILNSAKGVRDACMTGLDVLVAALAVRGAVLLQARWLAAVAGVWSSWPCVRAGWLFGSFAARAARPGAR